LDNVTHPEGSETLGVGVCVMPRPGEGSALRASLNRLNHLLAERGATVRVVNARNPAEQNILGDYFLVDHLNRHRIIRDHVDLHQLADEIGALRPGEKARG
jgi:hypothetical protein